MKILCLILLLVGGVATFAQHNPHSLKEEKVLKEIKDKTNYFDSLIIIDKANYWTDKVSLKGFGFRSGAIYKVDLQFRENKNADLLVKKMVKKKVNKNNDLDHLFKINHEFISALHDDSLNLRPPRLSGSDQSIWSVLVVNHIRDLEILKQSLAPLLYQKTVPTKQRRVFIEMVNGIEKELD